MRLKKLSVTTFSITFVVCSYLFNIKIKQQTISYHIDEIYAVTEPKEVCYWILTLFFLGSLGLGPLGSLAGSKWQSNISISSFMSSSLADIVNPANCFSKPVKKTRN